MKNIKILVSCHKNSFVPKNKILTPIHVGAKNKPVFDGMLRDDTGDNISSKNPRYCELTAQYWAWKNLDADYYGFFHYRRYLSFNKNVLPADNYNNVMVNNFDDSTVELLGLDENNIEKVIGDYDIIAPVVSDLNKFNDIPFSRHTVYNHYKGAPQHNIEDFDETLKILYKLYPEYKKDAQTFINSNKTYFLNMYIMNKKWYFKYCEWLYPILDEFDKNKDYQNCSVYELRTPGLLAERLFGIFLYHQQNICPDLKVKFLQQVFIQNDAEPYLSPYFKENNIPVCLASSDEYSPFASVVIQSIVNNSTENNNYDIILLSNNISENNKIRLSKIVEEYKNFSLRFIEVANYLSNKNLASSMHISISTYLRYTTLDILKHYDKILYLDCDLVVNADIAELYNTDISNHPIGAVVDTIQAGWYKMPRYEHCKKYNTKVLGIKEDYTYFNAGVLIMNLKEIRKHHTTASLFELSTKKNYTWLDQDVLNELFADKYYKLPIAWNFTEHNNSPDEMPENFAPAEINKEYFAAKKNPKIIHFAGRWTPCYLHDTDTNGIFWKVARQSPFYEKLLCLMINEINNTSNSNTVKRSWKRKMADKMFPKGTKRREFAKKIYRKIKKK